MDSKNSKNEAYSVHNSFADIANLYDGFLLDQFGVMHNGEHGLEGASELIEELAKKRGKRLVILSNSSSPESACLARLPKLGFDPQHFCGAVTSGEEASRYIASAYGSGPAPKYMVWLTWAGGPKKTMPVQRQEFFKRCGNIQAATSIETADFVLAHGSEVWHQSEEKEISLGSFLTDGNLDEIDSILKQCRSRDLPMICANPDFIACMADGSTKHMPGKIARRYEEMGGVCRYFGKPGAEHFEACVRKLGLPKKRVVHVGDSLHHDIAGANAAGLDSVFVTSGVHGQELNSAHGVLPDRSELDMLFEQHGQTPTHVTAAFRL